jgi:ankyrin repeat protein
LKLNDGVSSNTTIPTTSTTAASNKNSTKPDDYLRSLLAQHGMSTKTFSALEIKADFFLKVTAESVEAYDMQVVKAVRTQDVTTLRQLLQSGRSLQCGNKFGESIVHTACRKGSLQVLQFLLQEANVSCRVICDYGRTPLHDACWTSDSPNFQLMDLLLTACPDLLHVKDARGFLPLAYVRKEHWDDWCRYLNSKNAQQLAARELV